MCRRLALIIIHVDGAATNRPPGRRLSLVLETRLGREAGSLAPCRRRRHRELSPLTRRRAKGELRPADPVCAGRQPAEGDTGWDGVPR